MKKILALIITMFLLVGCQQTGNNQSSKNERKVGIAMYTFYTSNFDDMIPVMKSMGVDKIGLSRTPFSSKFPKARTGHMMNAQQRAYLKKLVKDNGLELVSYGVVTPKDEAEMKAICDFAKEMSIPLILTESVGEMLPLWEKYCQQYGLQMALHNHASDDTKRNKYYDPNNVKAALKGGNYYKNIFSCPDNGHWARSGLDSLEGFKTLRGTIKMIHIKDINKFGDINGHSVPLGKGELDMNAIMAELDSQNIDGYYMVEYETNPDNNVEDVKACVEFLRKK